MRVAVVTEPALGAVPGGVGRYTVELTRALAATAGAGDTVSGWCAWHRDVRAASIPGVLGPRRLPAPARVLPRLWARGIGPRPRGADLVHAPSPLFPPGPVPLVVTVHDAVPWTHPGTLTPHGARWHRAMITRAVRAGATIVTPTRVVADELLDLLPGLGAERVHALGGGVTAAVVAEPDAATVARVHAQYVLPERYVLAVATLEPRKGLDVLIDALGRLGADAPPLLVAGQPGWGGVDLEQLAASAGVTARALGRVPDQDLAVVLRGATVLVAPSRAEGFGLPVAEAMAAGTPVVISDAPALVEVAGGAAVVTPVGDIEALAEAVGTLLADPDRRAELSAAGRQVAAAHTWTAVAERAWALYRDVSG